ncbi:glycosyltransferase family 4 protein [Proteus terrae]|uniref:glycosyltransferase family 4 protein n=1 Tax=Proteus terrae TaxID=1574161 RepID=UPI001CBB294A|nr:glycosyltransferase family 4 protein [Proteus terrae]UAX03692.1 glycosyltransferase family 4 protein [Proteus terrae subsp. cibarius]
MIHFIQPAVPEYRVPFFEKIKEKYDIKIYTTKQDFLGVSSVKNLSYVDYNNKFINVFGKCLWMKNLPLFSAYKKGDVVVINGNPRVLNYMLLFLILRIIGVKTVWWGHGWSAGSYGLLSKVRIKLMKIANAVLVYTDKEKMKLNLPNCFALNNGLDSKIIKKSIFSSTSVRGPRESSFNLVFIGRITKKSNFEFLLHALSNCPEAVCLNVIGGCSDFKSVKKLSADLGLAHRINWLGPLYNEADIADVMLRSHVFVYPGSIGLSLIHAFNYSLPAIIHNLDEYHMPEHYAFENKYNGLSYIKGSELDLVDKITSFSRMDEEEYNKFSQNALNTVNHSFNVDDMVSRFEQLLESVSKW